MYEIIRIHKGRLYRDNGAPKIWKTTFARIRGEGMQQEFKFEKPVIDCLSPLWAEKWQQEGLFRRTQIKGDDMREGRKKKLCVGLHLEFWDTYRGAPAAPSDTNTGLTAGDVGYMRKERVAKKFEAITDKKMGEIMAVMILRECPPLSAHYIARKNKMSWPQFVIDFNKGLLELVDGAKK
jgi:hypothetical protein